MSVVVGGAVGGRILCLDYSQQAKKGRERRAATLNKAVPEKGFPKRLDNKYDPVAPTPDNRSFQLCCLKQQQEDSKFGKHPDKELRSKKKREDSGGRKRKVLIECLRLD